MNPSIARSFERCREAGEGAFIPYLTAGFPNKSTFVEIVTALADNGADIIEIGLPFSDPQADGPVIQASSRKVLEQGMTPMGVLDLVSQVRRRVSCPLVIMSYINPIMKMGADLFAARAAGAGAGAVILPDLPPEEAAFWLEAAGPHRLETIFMVAPTTPPERRDMIMNAGSGFLYYVSLTGVTGSDFTVTSTLTDEIRALKSESPLPVAVGFGVSGPEQARPLGEAADGVIVGSALIRDISAAQHASAQVAAAARMAVSIKDALKH
jgi:tryptophan synthase alpha chain